MKIAISKVLLIRQLPRPTRKWSW